MVFIPLLFVLFQICLALVVNYVVNQKRKRDLLNVNRALQPLLFYLLIIISDQMALLSGVASIISFVVLLVAKLMHPLALPWWPVFLPLFLIGTYSIFSCYNRGTWNLLGSNIIYFLFILD